MTNALPADREHVLRYYPHAAVACRLVSGQAVFRIAANESGRTWLGAWCGTTERAWKAAADSVACAVNDDVR